MWLHSTIELTVHYVNREPRNTSGKAINCPHNIFNFKAPQAKSAYFTAPDCWVNVIQVCKQCVQINRKLAGRTGGEECKRIPTSINCFFIPMWKNLGKTGFTF